MQNLTDLSTVRTLCEKYGFSLRKGFGQNFIVNPGVCPKICDAASLTSASNVLEIGPGFGTLTQQLALRAKKVVAVELDNRLLPVLEETLAGLHNVTIVQDDILKVDLTALLAQEFEGSVQVCANLPYYITSPILMLLLESRLPFTGITAMVQKEAAQRIVAPPGTREAGAITYAIWYYATPKLMFTVKPGSFYPPPTVTSAVIHLTPVEKTALHAFPEREKRMFQLIRAAFGQRRKTLANAVSAGMPLPKEQVEKALQQGNFSVQIRPEQLTLEQFIRLEASIWPK